MMKSPPSKGLVAMKNYLIFQAFFFVVVYAMILLRQSTFVYHQNAASLVSCFLRECHHKVAMPVAMDKGIKLQTVLEQSQSNGLEVNERILGRREKPSFLNKMGRGMKIGMVNMEGEDLSEWKMHGQIIPIYFQHVSNYFLEWKDLFPEWIDEEEENDRPLCPKIPLPRIERYGKMDILVAKLPCKWPEEGWGRDVFRLQVHLIAANLAVKRGRRSYWKNRRVTKVVFFSKCRPMLEVFRCDDLVQRDGDWWFYMPEMVRLEHKVSLPVGSCNLASPLRGRGMDEVYTMSKIKHSSKTIKREAYATVLHSSESYVCGAITLARSLLQTGTKRDLILLLDNSSISAPKQEALASAGWKIRIIERIRNPRARNNSYNEYNYSKFRLWQLTDYDKIIFLDSDIIVLRNIDILFHFPQLSATGNDGSIFNSGVMVIEPSNCTFTTFVQRVREVVSYNGGDQGFLNEIFVWWHRLPRRVNFLTNFWSNTTTETYVKNQLFGSDPPKLYAIHYLGLKPWECYRDYDCNWDIGYFHVYASDIAHWRWWKLHDDMVDQGLQKFCGLSEQREIELERVRKLGKKKKLHRRTQPPGLV